ncbi:MAG: SAM-dependent methyltransferase, partial [Nostoc sp.]
CNLEDIPPNAIAGCFFSNELVDAFPVHQFILETGELREIYVTTPQNLTPKTPSGESFSPPLIGEGLGERSNFAFVEVTGEPSTPQLAEYLDLLGINFAQNAYPDGYRSEINLAALDWLSIVADRLQRGYV